MSDAIRRAGVALLDSARRTRAGSPPETERESHASSAREPGAPDTSDLALALPVLLPRLWRFALRLAGDRHEAEDLVQRACVRALERRDQLRPGTSTLSWLFSIVHSIWLNEVRARKIRSHGRIHWSEGLADMVADPLASDPETSMHHEQIVTAVERLPDLQR